MQYHSSAPKASQSDVDLKMQAGYTSLLNGEDGRGETFDAVLNETAEFGYSPSMEGTNDVLRAERIETFQNRLIDEGTAEQIAAGMSLLQTNEFDVVPEKTQVEALTEDLAITAEPKTAEQLTFQQGVVKMVDGYSSWNNAKQAVLDGDRFNTDQGLAMKGLDFLTLMVPYVEQSIVAEAVAKAQGGDFTDVGKAFIFMGESKKDLIDGFIKMPLAERAQAVEAFADALHEANTVAGLTNDLNGQMLLEAVVNGDYSDIERVLDNMVSLMDASIVAKPIAAAVQFGRGAVRNARAEKVINSTKPASPKRQAAQANPDAERAMQTKIAMDSTDDTANALAGTGRDDAIADGIMPEVAKADGSVRNKTFDINRDVDKTVVKDQTLYQILKDQTLTALTKQEIKSANATVINRLQEAIGVNSRPEMFQVMETDHGAKIKAVFGAGEKGWSDPQDALDLTAIALREQGIKKEDMTVLVRDETGDFVPYVGKEFKEGDEYLVSVDYNYETNLADITDWSTMSTGRNFLDRIPALAERDVSRNILDPASMLDPHLSIGANVAVDKGALALKALTDKGAKFTNGFSRMKKVDQDRLWKYIEKANDEAIAFDRTKLRDEYGFTKDQIDVLQAHREYWDDIWAIRNENEIKAFQAKGLRILEDAGSDTRLFGMPKEMDKVDLRQKVYDPSTGEYKSLTKEELNKLYDGQGGVMQMRTPMGEGEELTDLVMFSKDNNPRAIRSGDTVYPYRDGYYQRSYDAPHFIVEQITLKDGRVIEKARATAQTTADANIYKNRLIKDSVLSGSRKKYIVRGDVKDADVYSGFEMDMYETFGRTSQRTRGKQLEDATAILNGTQPTHLVDPMESIIQSAQAMSNRASMSVYLDAAKLRYMNQFKHLFKNGKFPEQLADIGTPGTMFSKEVADARTQFNYIKYLERGYINMLDAGTKGIFRLLADLSGAKGLKRTETVMRAASKVQPTHLAKATAFHLYLGLNPLRTGIMNAHQTMLLTANFPKYVGTRLAPDMAGMTAMITTKGKDLKMAAKLSGRSESEIKVMYDEYVKSGLGASVNTNNLVRDSIKNMADLQMGNKAQGALAQTRQVRDRILDTSRRVGFDLGEHFTLMSSWLAHYDRAKVNKNGALTASDFARVGGEARNYTFNMNRAGDMAYNQNTLALFFQFFQVPHKALLLATANRELNFQQKARLAAFSMTMYSLPPAAMYAWLGDMLPDKDENPELHEMAVQGLQFYMFNKALSLAWGSKVDIDFSALSPADAYGIYDMLKAMATTDVGEMLASTPSGQLIMGSNPRIANVIKSYAGWITGKSDFGDIHTASGAFKDLASLSSGMSNFFRAKMALKYQKLHSATGVVTDESVNTPEAMAVLFGFRTMDEARRNALATADYETKSKAGDDVKKWIREYGRIMTSEGLTAETLEYQMGMLSAGNEFFKDTPAKAELFEREMDKHLSKNGAQEFKTLLKLMDYKTNEEVRTMFNNYTSDDETRKNLNTILDDVDKIEAM